MVVAFRRYRMIDRVALRQLDHSKTWSGAVLPFFCISDRGWVHSLRNFVFFFYLYGFVVKHPSFSPRGIWNALYLAVHLQRQNMGVAKSSGVMQNGLDFAKIKVPFGALFIGVTAWCLHALIDNFCNSYEMCTQWNWGLFFFPRPSELHNLKVPFQYSATT